MPAHSKTAKPSTQVAVIGIDIGKNIFHLIGLDESPETEIGRPSNSIVAQLHMKRIPEMYKTFPVYVLSANFYRIFMF